MHVCFDFQSVLLTSCKPHFRTGIRKSGVFVVKLFALRLCVGSCGSALGPPRSWQCAFQISGRSLMLLSVVLWG